MDDKLRLNTNLYGFEGIIGRRDYFLNCIIIAAISLFFTLPATGWVMTHAQTISEMLGMGKLLASGPIFLKLWFLIGIILTFVLHVSNAFRRINDINGDVRGNLNLAYAAVSALANIALFLPFGILMIFLPINFILAIIILFTRGKITSKYPYDFMKEFNWGAFLGTWIWGLFNKSFKTLWMLLLGLTPWGSYFAIYCGLKGNEWAFKNKKCTDVDAFNRSQEKQTTVFAILTFLILPIIYIGIIFGIAALLTFGMADEIKNNPEQAKARMEKLESALDSMSSIYFKKYEITETENKFYISSDDWKGFGFNDKTKILDMAASMAANKREKQAKEKKPDEYVYFSKTEELPRTKLYCVENGQLLGEFVMDESAYENASFKEAIKLAMKAYHFYNVK